MARFFGGTISLWFPFALVYWPSMPSWEPFSNESNCETQLRNTPNRVHVHGTPLALYLSLHHLNITSPPPCLFHAVYLRLISWIPCPALCMRTTSTADETKSSPSSRCRVSGRSATTNGCLDPGWVLKERTSYFCGKL